MKKLGFFGKLLFWINSLVVFVLFFSFFLPYIPPSQSPTLSILSLAVSPLLWLNFFFLVYWLLRRKRAFLLSGTALVLAYFIFNPFYKFSSKDDPDTESNSIQLLSYNVRLFNLYEANSSTGKASTSFSEIIKTQDADIVCLQEYIAGNSVDFSAFPYRYIHFKGKSKLGHAIYSKHKIINQGAFDFDGTLNNVLFADVVVKKDTLRVYNFHLQSIGIKPSMATLQGEEQDKVRKRLSKAFVLQEQQAKELMAHSEKAPYPTVLMGDLNNTPFSYVFKKLSGNMQDAFLERGTGLGTTFVFDFYPLRIDYIFASNQFNVLDFEIIETTFSDHKPIMAGLQFKNKE